MSEELLGAVLRGRAILRLIVDGLQPRDALRLPTLCHSHRDSVRQSKPALALAAVMTFASIEEALRVESFTFSSAAFAALSVSWADLAQLATHSGATLRTLDFSRCPPLRGCGCLASCGQLRTLGARVPTQGLEELAQLEELSLRASPNSIGDAEVQQLAEDLKTFSGLRQLHLGLGINSIGDAGVAALTAALAGLTELESLELELRENHFDPGAVAEVASSLRALGKLRCVKLGFSGDGVGDEGVQAIQASVAELRELQSLTLELGNNPISSASAAAIGAGVPDLQNLRRLELMLSHAAVGDEGLAALASGLALGAAGQAAFSGLAELVLELGGCSLGDAGAGALSTLLGQLPQLASMRLRLSNNNLGARGAERLAEGLSALPAGMVDLDLVLDGNVDLDAAGLAALAGSLGQLNSLRRLVVELSGTAVQGDGLSPLACSLQRMCAFLRDLELGCDGLTLGHKGADQLAAGLDALSHPSAQLEKLTLALGWSHLSDVGLQTLASRLGGLHRLRYLWLDCCANSVEDEGVVMLGRSLQQMAFLSTVVLGLGRNQISCSGVAALSSGLVLLTSLERLELSLWGNEVGSSGLQALGAALASLRRLSTLSLELERQGASVADSGVTSLAAGIRAAALRLGDLRLRLSGSDVTEVGARALAEAIAGLQRATTIRISMEDCAIGCQGALAFARSFRGLRLVREMMLNVVGNSVGAEGGKALDDLADTLRARGATAFCSHGGDDEDWSSDEGR